MSSRRAACSPPAPRSRRDRPCRRGSAAMAVSPAVGRRRRPSRRRRGGRAPARAGTDRLHVAELTAAVAARLARAEEEDAYEDALDAASNAVVHLVRAAKLDEAEAAARDLLIRFPDVHDGWDRLGMVHEARGDS